MDIFLPFITKENLQKFVKINKLEDRVKFLGFKQNVADYLKEADIFVLPSVYEGFGHVYLEAMACGLPTIALDANNGFNVASNEIIDHKKNGILIDNNSDELAEAIINITINKDIYKQFSLT